MGREIYQNTHSGKALDKKCVSSDSSDFEDFSSVFSYRSGCILGENEEHFGLAPSDLTSFQNLSIKNEKSYNIDFDKTIVAKSKFDSHQDRLIFFILSILGYQDMNQLSKILLTLSSSQNQCLLLREAGCIPKLVDMIYNEEDNVELSRRSSRTLHNIINFRKDNNYEIRVLQLIDQITCYCEYLQHLKRKEKFKSSKLNKKALNSDVNKSLYLLETADTSLEETLEDDPSSVVHTLMKLSYQANYCEAISLLGGLQSVANFMYLFQPNKDEQNLLVRRNACAILANVTHMNPHHKSNFCSRAEWLLGLRKQIEYNKNESLMQMACLLINNLALKSDITAKKNILKSGIIESITGTIYKCTDTKCISVALSSLQNLSAHGTSSKKRICSDSNLIPFLVDCIRKQKQSILATYVLRNVSSTIAKNETYSCILRKSQCLEIVINDLKYFVTHQPKINKFNRHSLNKYFQLIRNLCGILWNISGRIDSNKSLLVDLSAITVLKQIIKCTDDEAICISSSQAIKNLNTFVKDNQIQPNSPQKIYETNPINTKSKERLRLPSSQDKPLDYSLRNIYKPMKTGESQSTQFIYELTNNENFNETPLIYSRQSTPESLSNLEVNSKAPSSVFSTHMAESSIAYSDLPDSPSDCRIKYKDNNNRYGDVTLTSKGALGETDVMRTYAVEDSPSARSPVMYLSKNSVCHTFKKPEDKDKTVNYAVEGTPTCRSRANSPKYNFSRVPYLESIEDSHIVYNVEGTPLTYSRTSPLSLISEINNSEHVSNASGSHSQPMNQQRPQNPTILKFTSTPLVRNKVKRDLQNSSA
ncbi:hypothetical protein A3Q56_00156 [Intoshia linei]|uniref:Adenomatous polyposis coli protein n=1 Tax=Intoshia linei TaxID=1819745 RepID=A0A177BCX3_9BILA|nr:hypothetical protein A3Q56_00156 [Intoshia linei]